MKTITVIVRDDHLEVLARTKPMAALAELIWNALDAEATELRVEFGENELGGLNVLRIRDNGHGLHYDDAAQVFGSLGGSWKREGMRSLRRGRQLHGKYGKGRFRAFSLGQRISWNSVFEERGQRRRFSIAGSAEQPGRFLLSDWEKSEAACGLTVEIENVENGVALLRGTKALEEVTDIFAPYLRQYPDTRIIFDGVPLDPANAEERASEYALEELVMQNGERVRAELSVIEWKLPGRRGIYLCDANGFALQPALTRLHFRGFSYTAYLKSEHLAALEREGLLQVEELMPDVRQLLDAARRLLREHFTLREAKRGQDTLAAWRAQGIYPYDNGAHSGDEENERRIFDIYATHLAQALPDFSLGSPRRRLLMLRLIQELVHANPARLARVLDEVVSFPEDKEEAVLELLGRTGED